MIKLILSFFFGGIVGFVLKDRLFGRYKREVFSRLEDSNAKFYEFYDTLLQWVHALHGGKRISEYLKKRGYRTVAVYGMKELGELVVEELKDSDVELLYAIDKDAANIVSDIKVVSPNDDLEKVDVVIVTAIHWFDSIEKTIKGKLDCEVISLDDLLYEM